MTFKGSGPLMGVAAKPAVGGVLGIVTCRLLVASQKLSLEAVTFMLNVPAVEDWNVVVNMPWELVNPAFSFTVPPETLSLTMTLPIFVPLTSFTVTLIVDGVFVLTVTGFAVASMYRDGRYSVIIRGEHVNVLDDGSIDGFSAGLWDYKKHQ